MIKQKTILKYQELGRNSYKMIKNIKLKQMEMKIEETIDLKNIIKLSKKSLANSFNNNYRNYRKQNHKFLILSQGL